MTFPIKREIKSPQLTVHFELVFNDSLLTVEKAEDKLNSILNNLNNKELSTMVVMLLRELRASTWENGKVEVK